MVTTRKNNPVPSPRKKKLKRGADRAIQKQVFNKLLFCRANNGGKFNFGDIQNVVNEFQAFGYDAVTRRNLQYRFNNFIKKGTTTLFSERDCPTTVKLANVTEVSSLTVEDFGSNPVEKILMTVTWPQHCQSLQMTSRKATCPRLVKVKVKLKVKLTSQRKEEKG
jgi:hypothetical protein